jgi:wyosine [tRNA(Phe)-imidazoG37] synthetase (radical SAM superfamily)
MTGFLFDDIIFGPVISRRLGVSLGINLLPLDQKLCSFNCLYCECGFNADSEPDKVRLFSRKEIYAALERNLKELRKQKITPDSITFAGNGEPTLHPEFAGIIEDTNLLRDKYFPSSLVTVLSNSSTLSDQNVFNALLKTNNIMKLDSAVDETFRLLNNKININNVSEIVNNLERFNGKVKIQTMFLRGSFNNKSVDNTTEIELNEYFKAIKMIRPSEIMIYSIDRIPPVKTLEKISLQELNIIAERLENLGVKTKVY